MLLLLLAGIATCCAAEKSQPEMEDFAENGTYSDLYCFSIGEVAPTSPLLWIAPVRTIRDGGHPRVAAVRVPAASVERTTPLLVEAHRARNRAGVGRRAGEVGGEPPHGAGAGGNSAAAAAHARPPGSKAH